MKSAKRLLVFLLVFILLAECFSFAAFAEEVSLIDSGTLGENLTWTLDSSGLLTVSGEGPMTDCWDVIPWRAHSSKITSIVIEEGVTSIGAMAFNTLPIVSVTLPGTLKFIGKYAFQNCTKLSAIEFPYGLETIANYVFWYCSSLEYILIPDSVTSLGSSAFENCSKLQYAYLSSNLTEISYGLFRNCSSLEAVFLPPYLGKVEGYAFYGCNALTEVYFPGTEKQLALLTVSIENDPLEEASIYMITGITRQPADAVTIAGKTVRFTTAANRKNVSYQWYYLEPNSSSWIPCTEKSAQSATLSFTAKAEHDGYLYACLVTDAYGSQIETRAAALSIIPAPKITKQPETTMVKSGEKVSVTVEAEGKGLKYQWYYASKKSSKFKKASITEPTYSTTMNSSRDGRKLYCVITDQYGQTVKTQTVSIHLETTPIVITGQPQSITVNPGEKAIVKVAAEGDGLKYQWYYAKAGSSSFKKASIKKASYSVAMDASRNGRQLYCVVTDQYGKTAKTDIVTINMETVPLLITQQPESITVSSGEEAAVTVKAEGEGLKYQWYYAKKGSSSFKKASITGNTYSVKMDSSRNGRQLYCVVTDKYGQTVKTDIVSIHME